VDSFPPDRSVVNRRIPSKHDAMPCLAEQNSKKSRSVRAASFLADASDDAEEPSKTPTKTRKMESLCGCDDEQSSAHKEGELGGCIVEHCRSEFAQMDASAKDPRAFMRYKRILKTRLEDKMSRFTIDEDCAADAL
jgi:hypothetical protein